MSIRQYAYQKLFEEIPLIQFSLNLKIELFLCKDSFFKVMLYQILWTFSKHSALIWHNFDRDSYRHSIAATCISHSSPPPPHTHTPWKLVMYQSFPRGFCHVFGLDFKNLKFLDGKISESQTWLKSMTCTYLGYLSLQSSALVICFISLLFLQTKFYFG